jgi:hypothetical protein
MTIFYCLRFETSPARRARFPYLYPSGTGWPTCTPGPVVSFSHLLRLSGLRWRYSDRLVNSPDTDRIENVTSLIACSLVAGETVCPQSCSYSFYLAVGLHVIAMRDGDASGLKPRGRIIQYQVSYSVEIAVFVCSVCTAPNCVQHPDHVVLMWQSGCTCCEYPFWHDRGQWRMWPRRGSWISWYTFKLYGMLVALTVADKIFC